MVTIVKGIGGVVGRSLNLVTAGAIITGLAHLVASYLDLYYLPQVSAK